MDVVVVDSVAALVPRAEIDQVVWVDPRALPDLPLAPLTRDHVFIFETEARADRPTPVSLTHHSYFNLAGEGSGDIRGHELEVFSDRVFAVDECMTPLDRTEPVAGRGCDFTAPRRLGEAIPHLFQHHGDLYHLPGSGKMIRAARLHEPNSGRMLEVSTNEHCLQLYTGAALDGSLTGKAGQPYARHAGLCLECEGYPGGVDRPEFGNILAQPDQPLRRVTRYAFSTSASLIKHNRT
jgi:aldose 1-epimerase